MLQVKSNTLASKNEFRPGFEDVTSPEQKAMLHTMIRPEPWSCDFIIPGDSRAFTCGLATSDASLDPKNIICARTSQCSVEHANAYRTLYQIGSLPCCTTSPFCAAPPCKPDAPAIKPPLCTKRLPGENVAYLKREDVWPAYHGVGGSFELDTLKYLDLLGCNDELGCPAKVERPFDLMFDLGANTGYYTEKTTVRNFAKNYVLVEADPGATNLLTGRWGTNSWKQSWYTKQVALKEGEQIPGFEVINKALSNATGAVIDMCRTQGSMCGDDRNVAVATLDSLVPGALSPAFQQHFQQAQSAFIKVDTEGMDELVMRGMTSLLNEKRGQYGDGSPRFLVNFLMFEYAPTLMKAAREREGIQNYDLETTTKFLESLGFETFLIGPRFLPLTHNSWHAEYKTITEDPRNNAGALLNYPKFDGRLFNHCYHTKCSEMKDSSFTSDVFAIRSSHPRATELKVALGACRESTDFEM